MYVAGVQTAHTLTLSRSISMIIYQITNKITNDNYIGKTIYSINVRYSRHKYTAFKSKSQTYLHRAMRKYGNDNFIINKLDEANSMVELNQKEMLWIEKLKPKYNMTKGSDGGDTSSSPNFIQAMKKYHASKDSKSYATYGMLGKTTSDKTKKLIGIKNSCPVMCEGVRYNSVGEAQVAYPGISIRRRINNPKYTEFYRLRPKTKRK